MGRTLRQIDKITPPPHELYLIKNQGFVLIIRLEPTVGADLCDYKFFCFGGKPRLCQVISDRYSDEKIDFYDMDWKRLVGLVGLAKNANNSDSDIPCPQSFEEMKRIAGTLSVGIPFARIDLYEINRKPYFGEITFFPYSGFGEFRPEEWNFKIGSWIDLGHNSMKNIP